MSGGSTSVQGLKPNTVGESPSLLHLSLIFLIAIRRQPGHLRTGLVPAQDRAARGCVFLVVDFPIAMVALALQAATCT